MYLVSRTDTFAKLFFLLSFSGLLMYIVLAFYTFNTTFMSTSKTERIEEALRRFELDTGERFDKDLKYILLWTIPGFMYDLTDNGQNIFINNNCSHTNCYLTINKTLLRDVRKFNAIIFSIYTLKNWKHYMPKKRSPKQKYVFFSMISADKYPICNVKADNFFNWTWTYKFDSDIVTPFIEVRTLNGKVVAPKLEVDWSATEEGTDNTIEVTSDRKDTIHVGNKTKALMWYADKCVMDGRAVSFAKQLKRVLEEHSLIFDIYGCEFKECPKEGCFKALENDYYFYLVQEDGYAEDYVSTEVLNAYHHNAVPIVVGEPDHYAKFLPMHSYIDTAHESIERLSALIHYTIKSREAYIHYFEWKKHFTIHETNIQKGYCDLCKLLNNRKKVETTSVYEVFRKWWFYGSLQSRCYPKGLERYDDVFAYMNTSAVRKSKL